MSLLGDPGRCPICDAPHTTCTAPQAPKTKGIVVQVVPERTPTSDAPLLVAERVQATLPPGHFTTATYRRPKKGRPTRA
jgi:hypothetical protein